MPCDTITTSKVSLDMKVENKSYMVAALRTLGYNVVQDGSVLYFAHESSGLRGKLERGKITVEGPQTAVDQFNINAVKRAYSGQVVVAAAKKYGWQVAAKKENQYAVMKRGF